MYMDKSYSPFSCQSCELPTSFTAAIGKFKRALHHIFTKWALTGHQNTGNHLINHKETSLLQVLTMYKPETRTENYGTERVMEEIWEVNLKPDLLHD